MEERAVVLFSGGMDSTTLLYDAISKYGKENVFSILFDYRSKHNAKENAAALDILDHIGVDNKNYRFVDLYSLKQFGGSVLTTDNEVPMASDGKQSDTVVPGRNLIMISFGVAYAQVVGARTILIGACRDDNLSYPDCRNVFFQELTRAISAGYPQVDRVVAPYSNLWKREILPVGFGLGVPYELTYTCYKGDSKACGVCDACVERIDAFRANQTVDPVEYAIDIDWSMCKWIQKAPAV